MSGLPRGSRYPLVSVVVPALNCAADVDGFVAAMRRQDYPHDRFEIVVGDNGSDDATVERLKANSIRHVIRRERGRSRALNAGLQIARGEIVCTTDMSCRPQPGWIARVVECFEDASVGCVAGEIRLEPGHLNLALRYQARSNYMSPMHAASRRSLPFLPFADGANASFRRAVFDEIGPFDETFIKGADVEICYRMLVATRHKIVFCERAVVTEAGEPTLAALLRQRFRIGMGANLLKAKYPELYADAAPGNVLRRSYWSLARAARELAQAIGGPPRKDRLEDALVRTLMSCSQRLGRHYGRWYLRRRDIRPVQLERSMLRDFIANMDSLEQRVLVR